MKIKSYVITHDTGFAPNPYHGFLTLATCKPYIRNSAAIGDVIIATGSTTGYYKNRLIYAGIVSQIVAMDEYFNNPKFKAKKPSKKDRESISGDNIYYVKNNKWVQLDNPFHDCNFLESDLKSLKVLVVRKASVVYSI